MIFDAKHEMIRKLVRQFAETELTTEVLDKVEETGEFPEEIVGPSISTRPPSGRDSVPMICKSVVLPAPLAPTMETTSPCATSSETPFSTSSVPKLLCMSVARIIGGTY